MKISYAKQYGCLSILRASGLLLLLTLISCSSSDDNTNLSNTPGTPTDESGTSTDNPGGAAALVPLSLRLTGSEEVPPVDVPGASGIASLELDTSTGTLKGSIAVSGLSGPAIMAHLHQGFAGSNGAPVAELLSNSDGSQFFVPQDLVLDTTQLASITAGEYYLNVHTDNNPAGEIRAQITFGDVSVIRSTLSGENAVPPVASDASALAVTTLNSVSGAFNGVVFTNALESATAAHVHTGLAGATGSIIIGLTQDASDNTAWRTEAGAQLDPDGLAAYALEGLYYNVHTVANPDGELRGQIVAMPDGGEMQFTVTIENVSNELTLPISTGSEAVPLSPGAYVVHQEANNPLILPLDVASAALESLAEDGDPSSFPDFIPGSVVFNTPVGSTQPGPIFSGNSYSFTFGASPGDKLSFVTMFVESNDWFYTTSDEDNSISLFDDSGNPVVGDVSDQVGLWESGTEVDETPGEGPNQAGQGSAANTGEIESTGVGSLVSKGISPLINGQIIKVTLGIN